MHDAGSEGGQENGCYSSSRHPSSDQRLYHDKDKLYFLFNNEATYVVTNAWVSNVLLLLSCEATQAIADCVTLC